ncbi:MAG TPA: methyltransferase domain-containing protein [Acidimicrobiia bacterium]
MSESDRGQVAGSAAEVYEEFFVPALFGVWPRIVLEEAQVGAGHRVLDVACGTGVLAREALVRVGETGEVVGLDPNAGMLAVARDREPAIDWEQGVAEDLPFESATFDRVVSQFGMMFFTDPEKAIEEMARVLSPNGRIAVAVWASLEETPGYAAMVDLLEDLFGHRAADALRAPYVLGDPVAFEKLVGAVFPEVRVTCHEDVARFESIDAWVYTDVRGWTLSEMIDDGQYAVLLDEAKRRLSRFRNEIGRVEFPAPALIATARAVT